MHRFFFKSCFQSEEDTHTHSSDAIFPSQQVVRGDNNYKILCNEMAPCQSNYLINLLSACETLEKTGRGVSIIGISGSSGTTDRFRFIRERVSDTEGSEGGASTSSSIDPRDLLLFLRLKINKSKWGYKQWKSSSCSEYTNPNTQLFHDMAKKKPFNMCFTKLLKLW